MKQLMTTMGIAIVLTIGVATPNALASHGTDTASCEGDGLYDGKNSAFSQGLYDMCGDTYYDSFIEGCMSVDNSRDVCESATDAGE